MIPLLPIDKVLFLDIEVAPQYRELSDVPEPLRSYWLERYDTKRPEEKKYLSSEEYFLKEAGIHALYSRVVCIGMGYFSKVPEGATYEWKQVVLKDLDERRLLADFLEKWVRFAEYANKGPAPAYSSIAYGVCGHNILDFDIPFLGRRLLVKGFSANLPRFWLEAQNAQPWQLRDPAVIDTMLLWNFTTRQSRYISLEILAAALGLEFTKSLDHVAIREAFYQWEDTGDPTAFAKVEAYCLRDVQITAAIFLTLQGKSNLIPLLNL